jgi:hypothetical protein
MGLQPLFQAALVLVAFPVSLVIILRAIGPRDADVPNLFALDTDSRWPRGVQEEEPIRYRVELVSTGRSYRPKEVDERRARHIGAGRRPLAARASNLE